VLRTGYGVFYETIIGNIPGNVMLNPPYLPDYFNSAPFAQWPNAFAPSGFPVITVTNQKMPTPYAQHYNLLLQQELPSRTLLEVAYVGTSGTKLPRFRQIDQAYITQAQIDQLTPDVVTRMELMGIPAPVAQFLSTQINLIPNIARVPYFGYAQIFQAENSISSNYNSLQAKWTRVSRMVSPLCLPTRARNQLTGRPCSSAQARTPPRFSRKTTTTFARKEVCRTSTFANA
jgi:hypothetical protein